MVTATVISLIVNFILVLLVLGKLSEISTYTKGSFFYKKQEFIKEKKSFDLSAYSINTVKKLSRDGIITYDEYNAEVERRKNNN